MTSSNTSQVKLWTKDFILVLCANMCFYTASFLIIATIGKYLTQMNAPSVYISLSLATIAMGAFFMRFIAGNLLDIVGRRKMTFIGAFALLFCYLSYFFVGLNAMVVIRTINGVAWGIVGTAMATICTDVTPKEHRGDGLGFFAVSSVFCMAFSPMIAIIIYNKFDFTIIRILAVVFQLIAILCLANINIPKIALRKVENGHGIFNIKDMIEKKALFPSILNVLISISICAINSYIILHGTSIGVNSIWVYFIGHLLTVLLARTFAGRIVDKKGIIYVLIPGFASMMIGMLILWQATSLLPVVLASIFFGLGYGAAYPALQAWAVDRSPEDRRGAANGSFLAAMDLASGIGAFILTPIVEEYNTGCIYLLAAVFLAIDIIIVFVKGKSIINESKKSKFQKDLELVKKLKKEYGNK